MKRTLGLYVAWMVAAVMLVLAVTGKHPYSFYTLLRWICCAAFAYSAFTAHEKNRVAWVWIFGVLAMVFNPIVPRPFPTRHMADDRLGHNRCDRGRGVLFLTTCERFKRFVSDNQAEVLDISKARIAREWLIFLGTFPGIREQVFSCGISWSTGEILRRCRTRFTIFIMSILDWGGFRHLLLWFVPYLALC